MHSNKFFCNKQRIELIVNYNCNLRCCNCDALTSQAPTCERLSIAQIQKFVEESIENEKKWESIRVLGGEPTLHPDILRILDILLDYKHQYSHDTDITLVTNGHGEYVNKIIKKVPSEILIENSAKISSIQSHFSPVTVAPCDTEGDLDYSRGCWIPELCGIALDVHGYYACSFAAAADRVFCLNVGRKSVKDIMNLEDQFSIFCRYCGHFCDRINEILCSTCHDLSNVDEVSNIHKEMFQKSLAINHFDMHVFSKTWKRKLEEYRKIDSKNRLTKY